MKAVQTLPIIALSLCQTCAFVLLERPASASTSLQATSNYLDTLTRDRTASSSSYSTDPWRTQPARSSSRRSPETTTTTRNEYEMETTIVKFTEPTTPVKFVDLTVPPPVASTTAPVKALPEPPVSYEPFGDLDIDELYAKSTFPIKPKDLIEHAKYAIFIKGMGLNDNAECLADDFVFRGAHIETPREEFIQALASFNLGDAFYVKQQFFSWFVDPIQTNRVWFMNRQEATHIKEFFGARASGKKLVLPPECLHVDFNAQGQLKEFGFYAVDRFQGNTGGLGGAFGYFYGVGKPLPFPEARPYKMSKRRRMFEFVGKTLTQIKGLKVGEKIQAGGDRLKDVGERIRTGGDSVKAGTRSIKQKLQRA